jgi:hypothetical protein
MRASRRSRSSKKGGFWPFSDTSNSNTGVLDTISKSADDAGEGIVNAGKSGWGYVSGLFKKKEEPSILSTTVIGGKKRRRTARGRRSRRSRRGGNYSANTSLTNLASHASPIEGISSPKPCNWVGGKRRTRRHRKGSRRH